MTSLWHSLQGVVQQQDQHTGLWAWLHEKINLALYRPLPAPGVVVRHLTGREGDYYILKNPETRTYYRLSDRDYFLWQLMDGNRSAKDLVVAYFMEYGSFAFPRVAGLIEGLRTGLFLAEKPLYVYQQAAAQLARRRPGYRLNQLWSAFLQKQFVIQGLDRGLGAIYKYGGFLLFTWPMQILYVVVSLIGLYLFGRSFLGSSYGVVTIKGSYILGLLGLFAANLASIFMHELAHALTVKHYKREVRRGGAMIYLGLPAFWVDTMDIWLESKKPRLAVSWAGPYSGLILAGFASIALAYWPQAAINPLLFQFCFLSYLTVFFNLNPLLELDGYYLLMDWLEIPLLRHKSFEFIRTGLVEKLKAALKKGKRHLPHFSREERIFAIFGILSAVWTAYAIYNGALFWQQRLYGALTSLWTSGNDVGKVLLAALGMAVSLPFVVAIGLAMVNMLRKAFLRLAGLGVFNNLWVVAGLLLALAVGLEIAALKTANPYVQVILPLLGLAAAVYFALRGTLNLSGSRFALVFSSLAAFLSLLFVQQVLQGIITLHLVNVASLNAFISGLEYLAFSALALAVMFLFSDTNFKALLPFEKILVAVGLVASFILSIYLTRQKTLEGDSLSLLLSAIFSTIPPLVCLALLVPSLFSFWNTHFGPAWVILALTMGLLAAGWLPGIVFYLLAAAFFLHHLAYTRLNFQRRPAEAALDLNDALRLQRAFIWMLTSLHDQLREISGEREARFLVEQFNNYSLAAGWQVRLSNGVVEDTRLVTMGAGIGKRGEGDAAAITQFLDMFSHQAGEKLAVRALQNAYDGLPWQEREVAAQHLLPHLRRAESLSRDFHATLQDYHSLLQRIPLFAAMNKEEIDLLCSCLRLERFSTGQAVIRQGEKGDRFYILRQGHIEVSVRNEKGVSEVVNHLNRGDTFGELALLKDAPRSATCRVTVPSEVLSLSRQDFDRLVRARFTLREKLDQSVARVDLLRKMPLFSDMDSQQIQLIASRLQEWEFEPGDTIIRQGEQGETFFVIETGQVEVSIEENGVQRVVSQRGPGEYVGEIALLLRVPRTATVRASLPTRMLVLHKDDFDQLVARHILISPQLAGVRAA